MHRLITSLFSQLIGAVIPPRPTERIMGALTYEDMSMLRTENGLPYHHPAVTALIWELKYRANAHALRLAGEFLAEELLAIAEEEIGRLLIVPVPMHSARRRERGHNQTELLCKAALAYTENAFEYAPQALTRVRNTVPQQTLARHKRLTNVKNSMEVPNIALVKGRVCVVVDDVSTTGATLAEAKRALKKAGTRKVYTLALAAS